MIPIWLAPIIAQGMGLLGNAALAKGKEWVEEKTGVKLDQPLSAEDTLKLRQFEADHQEELLRLQLEENKLSAELALAEIKAVSDRWAADMSSDSWLSKNIRPMTLIALLAGYFMFALLSAWGINANEAYVSLLGQWGMLVMTAYFGGRTLEKVIEMRSSK